MTAPSGIELPLEDVTGDEAADAALGLAVDDDAGVEVTGIELANAGADAEDALAPGSTKRLVATGPLAAAVASPFKPGPVGITVGSCRLRSSRLLLRRCMRAWETMTKGMLVRKERRCCAKE